MRACRLKSPFCMRRHRHDWTHHRQHSVSHLQPLQACVGWSVHSQRQRQMSESRRQLIRCI